jgi:uncharacterized protein
MAHTSWPAGEGGREPRLTLNLTHACNLACAYCYAGEKSATTMGPETGRAAIDLVLQALAERGGRSLQIAFFGGEPLLAWPRLVDLADHASRRATAVGIALSFQVTTNGTLLSRERIEVLARLGADVAISLDGLPPAHDATRPTMGGRPSGSLVWQALERALPRLPGLSVIAVLDPANVAWLGESVAALADAGVRRITLNPNYTATWPEATRREWQAGYARAAEVYVDSFRRSEPLSLNVFDDKIVLRLRGAGGPLHGCGFGEWDLAVAPSGRLYPCGRAVAADRDPASALGDVGAGVQRGVLAPARTATDLPEPCRGCAHRDRCASRCGCANRETTGDPRLPGELICWHERMSIPHADRAASTLFAEGNPAFLERFYGIAPAEGAA